jgi:glutaredoxin 2
VLVLDDGSFLNEPNDIIQHLTENHQIGHSH